MTSGDWILWAHARLGLLGILSAVWVFGEALNARKENTGRTRKAALIVLVCMLVACVFGGYWYVHFYPAEKAIILEGPWPFAHNVIMETKTNLFFVTLILSFYLPIAAWDRLYENATARKMVLWVAMLIVLTGLASWGAGTIVNHAAKIAIVRISPKP